MQISVCMELNDDDEISKFLKNSSLVNGIVKKSDLVDMIIKEYVVKDPVKVDDRSKTTFPPVGTPVTKENFVKGMICYFTDSFSDFEEYKERVPKHDRHIRPIYEIKEYITDKFINGKYKDGKFLKGCGWRYCFVANQDSSDI